MQHEGEWRTSGTLTGGITYRDDHLTTANLYCLHIRTRRDFGIAFQLDALRFGDACVTV